MIVALEGTIVKKEPTLLWIDVGGITYEVFISLSSSASLSLGPAKIYTTFIVREDSQSLYGFAELEEKKMFDRLIKLNGVGPKVALAICSTFRPSEFVKVVQQKNVAMLKKVPGIGPKSAQRILVELGEFNLDQGNESSAYNEAALALESLGFKKDQVQRVLAECSATETAELVKEALKKIQKI